MKQQNHFQEKMIPEWNFVKTSLLQIPNELINNIYNNNNNNTITKPTTTCKGQQISGRQPSLHQIQQIGGAIIGQCQCASLC